MKIGLVTDTHFGARNDTIAFSDYFFKFYDEVFFPYLEEHDIKTVIHLGDIVDRRKYINYNTLKLFRDDFVYRLGKMGIDTHVIIGNHDTYFKNTNEINSMDGLFTTLDGKYEPWIYSDPVVKTFDGLDILMLPWINQNNFEKSIKLIQESTAPVIMGHLEVKGFLMRLGSRSETGLPASLFERFDLVMTGHFHHKSNDGTVHYLGAPYEITWSDYNDPRGFHIFDTDTRELTYIQNPHRMFYKIFYDDTDKTFEEATKRDFSIYTGTHTKVVVQHKNNPYWFDIFLDGLYKADPHDVSIVENFDDVYVGEDDLSIDQAEDTLTILNHFVDNLETESDKSELKKLLHGLYSEAINMERE